MRRPTVGELAQALRQKSVVAATAIEIATAQNQKKAREHLERAYYMGPEAAIAELELAIQAWPEYAEAFYELAKAHTRVKSLAQAVSAYERAILLDPSLVAAHIELAKIYKDQGSLQRADRALREALRRDPDMVFSRLPSRDRLSFRFRLSSRPSRL